MIALMSWVELHSEVVSEKDETCVSGDGQMNWRVEHS